jgi:regulator of sigma E protease
VTTLLAFAFVLGVLVFVHELGHFLAAKRVGIRVLKFQLGFNPTIWSFRHGDTEYGIGAVPLGGYVRMAGESPEENPSGAPDEFMSKTKWQRFQVLIMGPAMNVILAVVLTTIVLIHGQEVPAFLDQPPVVGAVADGSPAAQAGIQPGDRIQSIGGRSVDTWEQFLTAVGARPNRTVAISVARDGTSFSRDVTPVPESDSGFEIGQIGVLPDVHPHLSGIMSGEAAEHAGLKAGDVVVSIDGKPINFTGQLRDAVVAHPNQTVQFVVLRNGQSLTIPVTLGRQGDGGWLGALLGDATKTLKTGPFRAAALSVQQNVQLGGMIFQTIGDLLTRKTSPKQLMGPVAIAQLSGESAQLGWVALFTLMATISLNLGILNLLPIPILDGGHILIMGLEGLTRHDFSIRVKEKMLLAGFLVLMMLMVTVIYNDLMRITWIQNLVPWH